MVEFLVANNQLKDEIGDCLDRLPDLKKLTHKLSSKKCNLMDCCKIYQSFFFIHNLTELLESQKNDLINEEFTIKLKDLQNKCSNFSKLIDETVDKESLERGDPLIDARYDESLTGYAGHMTNAKENAEQIFNRMANELDLDEKSIKLGLDVYYSLADAANYSSQSYVRPKMLPKGSGKIKLTDLRHPCLENQINVYYIPNSIDFDKDNKKFFIVTGPNMGGKSTFLRSIGWSILQPLSENNIIL